MKKLKAIWGLLILMGILISCDDDNDYEIPRQAIGDVFVRCMKSGNDTVYAPVMYVHSNFNMSSVSVEGPDGSGINTDLTESGSKIEFRSVPETNDFSTNDVSNGIYQFEIVSEDTLTYTINDELEEKRIAPVEITEFTYESTTHEFDIDWEDIEGADVYVVKIRDSINGELIYVSDGMVVSKHEFSTMSGRWSDFNKKYGEQYVLGVYAYQFETSTTTFEYNCESVEYLEFEW